MARRARAPVPFSRSLLGQGAQGVLGEGEADVIEGEKLGVLLGQRVLGVGQHGDEFLLRQFVEHADHRQAPDEFGDEAEGKQVLRLHAAQHGEAFSVSAAVSGVW